MLNYLISVMSDTYVRVTNRSKMHTYRYRNQLNIEYLSIRDNFIEPMKVNCMFLVTAKDDYQNKEDENQSMKELIYETKE